MKKNSLFEDTSKIVIIIGAVLFFGSFFLLLNPSTLTIWASLGDMSGGLVGSVWALAGVLLFYAALKSQQEALKDQKESTKANIDAVKTQTLALELQIKEFELQRKELEDTRKVFEYQSSTLDLQRFENTYFQLIKLKQDLFQNIFAPDGKGHKAIGVDAYNIIWLSFCEKTFFIDKSNLTMVRQAFHQNHEEHKIAIETYFTTIFHILQSLDRSRLEDKMSYVDLFVAQLSELDKLFLFYLGSIPSPGNKLKPLLEKYHVLRFLDTTKLIDLSHQNTYDPSAYAPSDKE